MGATVNLIPQTLPPVYPAAKHSSESNEQYTPIAIIDPSRSTLIQIDMDPASSVFANQVVQAKQIYTIDDNGLDQEWVGRIFLNPPGGALRKAIRGTRSSAVLWWLKLVESYERDQTESAIFIGFSLEIMQAVQSTPVRHPMSFPCCLPKKRIAFDVLADDLIARLRTEQSKLIAARPSSVKQQKKIVQLAERIEELEPLRGQRVAGEEPPHGNVIVYLPPVGQDARRAGIERFVTAFARIGYIHAPGA